MSVDLTHLIGLVKTSKLLTDDQRKEWLQKMETMTEQQLIRLQDILGRGERIDWATELPKYEAALQQTEAVIQQSISV